MIRDDAPETVGRMREFIARVSGLGVSALLHLALLLPQLIEALPRGDGARPAPKAPAAEIVFAPPEDDEFPGLSPFEEPDDEPAFEREYENVEVKNATFDVTRIAKRAHVLFPFVSPGLSLDLFALTPQDAFQRFLNSPMTWSSSTEPAEKARPLSLTPEALQRLIDQTWARRDRWDAVQPVLEAVQRHDPDSGDTPRLVREYTEQNLGQYYEDTRSNERDARLWTELALAADHVDFIRFVRNQVSAHPGTTTTTELLFLLDKVVESNRNVLASLVAVEPARHLEYTRLRAKESYELIRRLRAHYGDLLAKKGLRSEEDVTIAYAKVRLAVLDGILRTTPRGYRANDARVLMGTIHWALADVGSAVGAWCEIRPDPTDEYVDVADDLIEVLRLPAGADVCTTRKLDLARMGAIDKLLRRERGRLWEFQYRRLAGFGYSLNMF